MAMQLDNWQLDSVGRGEVFAPSEGRAGTG